MDKTYMMEVAIGERMADLVLKNGYILNVFSERIITADVAIVGETIVGIGSYHGEREIDCTGKYIAPGFIDAHIHIESTMVLPMELSKMLLKSGTTTLIADPHELVNVKGDKALDFLLDATEHIPLNVYIMLPSSVPATKYDTNGAGEFLAKDMEKYLSHPRILGLGEVMCFLDVLQRKPKVLDKLSLFKDKIIDGHAPGITEKEIQTYRLSGVDNDHECVTFDEALEKIEAGFHILIREGSGAKNLDAIVRGLLKHDIPLDRCAFCTDDRHLEDMERDGHISYCIRKAISRGMDPVKAYKMGSFSAAQIYGLKDLGAVAAGYKADLVILDNLEEVTTCFVMKSGMIIDEASLNALHYEVKEETLLHTVILQELTSSMLSLTLEKENHVIEMIPEQLVTNHLLEKIPGEHGIFIPNKEYNKLCVIERYGKSGCIGIAPLKGFGIVNGAIATSVSHDSHNIIVAGDNDKDILLAVNKIKETQGGYVIASMGKVIDVLPLSVGGLMSTQSCKEVQEKASTMLSFAHSLGIPEGIDPFITLSFLALPVIPHLRLLDRGLFDVDAFQPIGWDIN
ncbi:MAG: adenine deaminase [Velocimicrobium sp.]